jgi:hypothetical protein
LNAAAHILSQIRQFCLQLSLFAGVATDERQSGDKN